MSGRPLTRKYARIERERRFLLDRLPDDVDANQFQRLRDTYIEGTQLRLRRVENPDGSVLIVKLGQKVLDPDAPSDPRRRQMTTIYMDDGQAFVFSELPGRRSVKRRYKLAEQGRTFCIDVYEAPNSAVGVIVAEVECDSDAELDAIARPYWARREVTEDPTYSGSVLAR